MARPKKSPRERFQITLPKPTAKKLRAVAKKLDRELSEVVNAALVLVLDSMREDSTHDQLRINVPYYKEGGGKIA